MVYLEGLRRINLCRVQFSKDPLKKTDQRLVELGEMKEVRPNRKFGGTEKANLSDFRRMYETSYWPLIDIDAFSVRQYLKKRIREQYLIVILLGHDHRFIFCKFRRWIRLIFNEISKLLGDVIDGISKLQTHSITASFDQMELIRSEANSTIQLAFASDDELA